MLSLAGPNIAARDTGRGHSSGKSGSKGSGSSPAGLSSASSVACGPVHGMRFGSDPPRALPANLPFCSSFSHNTCCNATNAQEMFGRHMALIHSGVRDSCALVSETLACYPCHPSVGTGAINSVCPSLCNRWLETCGEEFYAVTLDGKLQPCHEGALVCSRLKDVFQSGSALCSRMGYRVALSTHACYDGTVDPLVKGVPAPKPPANDLLSKLKSVLSKDGSGTSTVDQEEVYEALATASVAVVVGLALWKGLRLCREYRRRSKEAAARRALILQAAEARRTQ